MRGTNIFGEVERKNEEDRTKTHQYASLAIGAFAALVTLTIVLITQKLYNYFIITILLILMLLVLISGFYGVTIYQITKNYFGKRKHNELAKVHFKEFKKLVLRFSDFANNLPDDIPTIMHSIKNTIPAPNPFSQINVVGMSFIKERYTYYDERLNKFDGTKDNLVSLTKEFESILDMYDMLYIKDPVNAIRIIGQDKVPKQYKESFNKARLKYIAFLNDYKNFAKVANEDLKEKEEYYGFLAVFREHFDFPEEL
jgi:hypothetical protein